MKTVVRKRTAKRLGSASAGIALLMVLPSINAAPSGAATNGGPVHSAVQAGDSARIGSAQAAAQCSKPVTDRVGAWSCEPPPPEITTQAAFCRDSGRACWNRASFFEASNYTSCSFGRGTTVYGKTTLRNADTYKGAALKSTFILDSTVNITSVTWVAQRLDTYASANGTPVTPRQTAAGGSVYANGSATKTDWAIYYDNTARDQSLWHEANWKKSGDTATFYVFQKSLEAHKNTSAGGRYEYYETSVPTAAYGCGTSG